MHNSFQRDWGSLLSLRFFVVALCSLFGPDMAAELAQDCNEQPGCDHHYIVSPRLATCALYCR